MVLDEDWCCFCMHTFLTFPSCNDLHKVHSIFICPQCFHQVLVKKGRVCVHGRRFKTQAHSCQQLMSLYGFIPQAFKVIFFSASGLKKANLIHFLLSLFLHPEWLIFPLFPYILLFLFFISFPPPCLLVCCGLHFMQV